MKHDRRIFVTCYAASGAAALVYQVAWTRLFSLQLGHTTAASSTVLAAFMGGMAVGAWIGGHARSDSGRRLLQLYAAIELFIAAIAFVLPGALLAVVPVLTWAYADGATPTLFAFVRVAISLVLVGLPAAAMGATFPIAVAWLVSVTERANATSESTPAATVGVLYAANTAGAALGAISAGFWLIPAIGLRATTAMGIALNTAAAIGALWLARHQTADQARQHKSRRTARTSRRAAVPRPALACTAAALSGFLALVYEVTWTRLLALVLGPTTYAFATMAASFITGIAFGSFIGTVLARRVSDPALWLGGMLAVTAVSAPAAAWFTASRVPLFVASHVSAGAGFESIVLQEALAVALLVLPTSIALGAGFVLAVATATSATAEIGRDTARVYAANTIGAVVGALSAGFVLIPHLGLQSSFVEIGRVGAIGGIAIATLALLQHARKRALIGAVALAAAVAAVFGALPDWDRQLLSSGAYKYSRSLDSQVLDATLRAGTLEYYKEGAAGTVSVRRTGGSRALAIDGKVDASNAGDMLTQRLLGLLPVMLHDRPADALVIGLGSGVTADAVLASGEVQRLDVVEISPEVVEASAYFERENRGVLKKPGVRLLIGDGRSHLQLSTRQYDVIVSEPSNPWMAGVAALFTREFFEAVRTRLRPGGVFCQWAHTYEIAEQDLQSIVRTFASVFPDGTLWLVGDGDLLLIGTAADTIESRVAGIPERWRKGSVPALLADVEVAPDAAPFVLLSFFAGGPAELTSYGSGAALQTDDGMSLEFTAVRALYAPPSDNAVRLRALRARAVPPSVVATAMQRADARDWTARGVAALKATSFGQAHESFRRALALDSRSADALRGATDAAAGAHSLVEETDWLKTLAAAEPNNAAVRVELSHALAALGSADAAVAAAMDAARIDPAHAEPLEQLAAIFADLGDAARLAPVADELVSRFPARDETRYYRAAALFLTGRASDAENAARTLLRANPRHARGQNLLGVVCAARGNHECARAAFGASLDLNPRDPSVYVNLGYLNLEKGDAAAAAEFFSEALAIDPTSEAARQRLAEARAAAARE
jgi:spermidine synthase